MCQITESPASASTARPGPITRLPPELIRMILKDCCAEPTVAKAARVCREWNQIAVPVLYNSVDLGEGVELELWVINGSEYRWYKEGRDRSDARIAPMSLSIRLLHTLRQVPASRTQPAIWLTLIAISVKYNSIRQICTKAVISWSCPTFQIST